MAISSRQQAEAFVQDQITALLQQDSSALPPDQLQDVINAVLKNTSDLWKIVR